MTPCRPLLTFPLLACALLADAAHGQSPAKDLHGDPLPPGAIARLGTLRFRHDSPIVYAAFLPGGKGVISVSNDGVACAWELPSGKELHRFEAFPAKEQEAGLRVKVSSASLSPDGKHLTVFCADGFLRIWDWASIKQVGKAASVRTRPLDRESYYYDDDIDGGPRVYSPDGKTLMLRTSRVLQLLEFPTGKSIGPSLGHITALNSIHFVPGSGHVLTSDSATTRTWDPATGKELGTIHTKLPPGMRRRGMSLISPNGRVGVLGTSSSGLDFGPGGLAVARRKESLVLFDAVSGKELGEIAFEAEGAAPFRRQVPAFFSPDNQLLAVCLGSDPKQREQVGLYEVPSGKLLRTLDAGPPAPLPKAGKGKGIGGVGGKGGVPLALLRSLQTQRLLFSPDGKALAFQPGPEAPIVVLDTATGQQLGTLTAIEGSAPTMQGAFAPDGRCLALEMSDGMVTLYELATGQPRRSYGDRLPATSPSPEDELFFGGGLGGFGGGPVASARLRSSFAISPDGKVLALARPDHSIRLLDTLTGKEVAVFKGHTGAVTALAFAPHGKTLASASADTTALVWDVTRVKRPAAPARAARPGDREAWWQALAEGDAARAFAAMGDFLAAPEDAIAFFKARLKPAVPLNRKRVAELIGQLNHSQFKVRDRATRELLQMGDHLVPELDKVLAANPSPETQQRVQELRGKLTAWGVPGERLRAFRAVEVLERLGTPQARALLQTLAGGAPGALLTTSAQAALKR